MKFFKWFFVSLLVVLSLSGGLFANLSFLSSPATSSLIRRTQAQALAPFVAPFKPPLQVDRRPQAVHDHDPINGVWVVRIRFDSSSALRFFVDEFDIWSVNQGDKYAVALVTAEELGRLSAAGYEVEVDAEQMRRLSEIEQIRREVTAAGEKQTPGIPGFPCYRTVEETHADLRSLALAHPTLVQWIDIGDSWDKVKPGGAAGYDLHALVLTNQKVTAPKPRFFVVAAVHARELATAELATRFAERLVALYGEDPDVTWLLDFAELHLVPYGNPDGRKQAEQLIYWRKNRNLEDAACVDTPSVTSHGGVDLNRNSSFKWNGCDGFNCSSSQTCSQTFRGPSPVSEPETQALQGYMSQIFSDTRPLDTTTPAAPETSGLMITIHSYSELVLFPWGWSRNPPPNATELATLGRKFGYHTGYGVCQSGSTNCLYQADGLNDDWAYGELGVAAYTFELGTEFFQACEVFEEEILEDNLNALTYGFKAARRPYQLPAGPEVVEAVLDHDVVLPAETVTLSVQIDDTRYGANGPWGDEPTQVISAARYSVDLPSWFSGTRHFPLTLVSATLTSTVKTARAVVDPRGWELGQHTLFIEAQDADGNWGVPTARFLTRVEKDYAARVSAEVAQQSAKVGQAAVYSISLRNVGERSDGYTLTLTSTWSANVSRQSLALTPGQSGPILIQVVVPAPDDLSSTQPFTDTATLEIRSRGTGQVVELIRLTTAGSPYRRFFPFIAAP